MKEGIFAAANCIILAETGPPWPFLKGKEDSTSKAKIPNLGNLKSVVPVGEGCTLYLSLPDDPSLPSTISMRLKAYTTMVDSSYQLVRSLDVVYGWFEPTDLTINFSGNQIFTIGKGSAGQAVVKFQFTDQPFIDEPDLLGTEMSIFGHASSGGIDFTLNCPYLIVP